MKPQENAKKEDAKVLVVGCLACLILFLVMFEIFSALGRAASSSPDTSATQSQAPVPPQPATAVTPAATSPEQQLKDLMKNRFGDRLRNVDVAKQYNGGYGVFVKFSAGDNLTTDMVKGGIELDMKQAYKDLYTSNLDVRQAEMAAFSTTQDKFGNGSDACVYKTGMDADVGNKINWDNWPSLDFSNLWTVDIQNPSFQQ